MNTSQRINGFDALRTIAMWLGIVLHAIIAYKVTPEKGWANDTQVNLTFLDWLYNFIHCFRMPLFFLVAGFFARMVIIRSGIRYFIKQRIKRILIPFVAGIIILVPFTMLPFHFYRYHYVQGIGTEIAWQKSIKGLFQWDGIAHLWFLYYLIQFYICSLGISLFVGKSKMQFAERLKPYLEKITLFKILIITLFLFLLLSWQGSLTPPIYTGLKPKLFNFLYYAFFYFLGWFFQINMKSVLSLSKNGLLLTVVGTVISIFSFWFGEIPYPVITYLLYSLKTVTITFGITGLFMLYANSENSTWRYFSDSAYWVYLSHMGIVAFLQVALLDSLISPWLRLPIVLMVTFLFCMGSYYAFVRYTVIGTYLHGKREKNKSFIPIFFYKKIARAKKTN